MASPRYQRRCDICSGTLKKNGKTTAGKTRYRCTECGASTTARRQGPSRQAQLNKFVAWILGSGSRQERSLSRTDRRNLAWCWNVEVPQPEHTGEVFETIMVDGTYLASWCLLVASNGSHVIGWQWADKENTAAYIALLERFGRPELVVSDGHKGAWGAVNTLWPSVPFQRCFFHIRQRVKKLLTLNPRTQAGIEINMLTKTLMKISDPGQAAAWLVGYHQWDTRWQTYLKERSYRGKRPPSLIDDRSWWYTHERVRQVRTMYRHIIKTQTLFTYLTPLQNDPHTTAWPRTTSPLEGGVNAGIKRVLERHRGMSADHARRAVEWYLNSRTETPASPHHLIRPEHYKPTPPARQEPIEQLGPIEIDTAYNQEAPWEDGIWQRKGWAGH